MFDPLEGYARLPEDLLRDLLGGADQIVDDVNTLLAPAMDNRRVLRNALEDLDLVRRYAVGDSKSLCGVDGGFAVERTSAVDLLLSVAVGVEGLRGETQNWDSTQYQWWSSVRPHDHQSERLARGIMVAQELAIIAAAPHTFRILDGSHLTLVIQLNTALTAFDEKIRAEAERVWTELGTVDALHRVSSDPSVIAMPKYDSSRVLVELLERATRLDLPGDDKQLMSILLAPGEMTTPYQVPNDPWAKLHFNPGGSEVQCLAERLMQSIRPLKERRIRFVYVKPDAFASAFRVEVKDSLDTATLDTFCTTLDSQITGPFIREPYPQYLADVMAKSVGLGLTALQSAVQLALSRDGRPEIAELLVRSYRTEGV